MIMVKCPNMHLSNYLYANGVCIFCDPLTQNYDTVLNNLYDDMIIAVSAFLTPGDKASFKRCSKKFNKIVQLKQKIE
jgi:hypothetical protein